MDRIFLAFSYRSADQQIVRPMIEFTEAVLEAHAIRAITGESVGGEALTPAIMSRINDCDALIAVLTPNQQREDNSFDPHPWVRDELNYARGQNKSCIALIHPSVAIEGAWQEHERIIWNPGDPLQAARRLVQTVGLWKLESGRVLKIMLLPEDVATRIARNPKRATCEYRLIHNPTGKATQWRQANVFGEIGGTFAWIRGALDDSLLEVRVQLGRELWYSRAAPQFIPTKLKRGERQ
jgi:hypothetical protein